MLSREHQHNQNDLSQRISAAEERESNHGLAAAEPHAAPTARRRLRLRPRSAETADADAAAAATAADAATHAAAAASAVTTPRLIELASPRLGDANADEPSSQALRVRFTSRPRWRTSRARTGAPRPLKQRRRTTQHLTHAPSSLHRILRQHSVLQKVIEIRRMDALETLKATSTRPRPSSTPRSSSSTNGIRRSESSAPRAHA